MAGTLLRTALAGNSPPQQPHHQVPRQRMPRQRVPRRIRQLWLCTHPRSLGSRGSTAVRSAAAAAVVLSVVLVKTAAAAAAAAAASWRRTAAGATAEGAVVWAWEPLRNMQLPHLQQLPRRHWAWHLLGAQVNTAQDRSHRRATLLLICYEY